MRGVIHHPHMHHRGHHLYSRPFSPSVKVLCCLCESECVCFFCVRRHCFCCPTHRPVSSVWRGGAWGSSKKERISAWPPLVPSPCVSMLVYGCHGEGKLRVFTCVPSPVLTPHSPPSWQSVRQSVVWGERKQHTTQHTHTHMSSVAVKLWEPDQRQVEATALARFMRHVNQAFGLSLGRFHLCGLAITHPVYSVQCVSRAHTHTLSLSLPLILSCAHTSMFGILSLSFSLSRQYLSVACPHLVLVRQVGFARHCTRTCASTLLCRWIC